MEILIDTVFMAACYFAGHYIGRRSEEDDMRQEAIDAGVALWTIDPKTGDKEFQFISPEQPISGTGRG